MTLQPLRKDFLPFAKPDIDETDIEEVIEALKSGWLSKGPKVFQFEKELSEFLGVKHTVSCNSGTAALHLALLAAGIGPKDEVIVPSFTFCASVNVILHVGAKPVFVDIDEDTLCLDVKEVAKKITKNTKAIMAVHFAGRAADLTSLRQICDENNLLLIEDAAHAIGTEYQGKLIGNHGDIVCFSFYATKNMTTGEGGALVTNHDEIAEKARLYGWLGISKSAWNRYSQSGSWFYEVKLPGYKYNMTDIQAGLGIVQLRKLEKMRKKRASIANYYLDRLKELDDLVILPKKTESDIDKHSWHLFPIQITSKWKIGRDDFIEMMKKMNIGTSVHFIPVHLHPYYKEKYPINLPVTEKVYSRILSLPIYSAMTMADAEDVVNTIIYLSKHYQ